MRSELKEEGRRQDLQQQNSTQTFILKKIVTTEQMVGSIAAYNHYQFKTNISKPILNRDHKHYTPAFINETQKGCSQSCDGEWAQQFGDLMQQQCTKNISLLIPKPKSTFCYVCKQHYQDYLKHTNHPIHKKWRDASYCEDDIKRFILEFQQKIKHKEGDSNSSNKPENSIKTENTAKAYEHSYKTQITKTFFSSHKNQNQQQASICSTKFLNFD